MAQFLFRAQDRNMTNGDFAFFTLEPVREPKTDHPWAFYVDNPDDLPRRRRAFYAVKQVLAITLSPASGAAARHSVNPVSRHLFQWERAKFDQQTQNPRIDCQEIRHS